MTVLRRVPAAKFEHEQDTNARTPEEIQQEDPSIKVIKKKVARRSTAII